MDENRFIRTDEAVFFDGRAAFFQPPVFRFHGMFPVPVKRGFLRCVAGAIKRACRMPGMPFEKKLTFRF
ncbi:MAG: hypothetical protein KHX31_03380 [Akkermansia sp.]|uniref:hypothetical protein n=1 Tax=Akkermansia sp. TaxID=1872421 RepID=UPI0025B8A627|nr:hypothetical protein [Akkermansia sp.]MBS5507656.1 hypothetical protein [Akkermansia sp.]